MRLRRGDGGSGTDHGPSQRGDPLRILRAPVCGAGAGLLPGGRPCHRADQRRRRRQGDDRRGVGAERHRPGRAGELHLHLQPGQGRLSRGVRPADGTGRRVPHGPHRRALRLGGSAGQDHHRRPQGRRTGDDAGVRPAAARPGAPGGRDRGYQRAVQHDGRSLHRRPGGLCDAVRARRHPGGHLR